MSVKEVSAAHLREIQNAMAALQRAAEEARKIAIQTDTAIIVVQDGKPVRITADQLRAQQAAGKGSAPR